MARNTTKLQYEQKMGNLLFKYWGAPQILGEAITPLTILLITHNAQVHPPAVWRVGWKGLLGISFLTSKLFLFNMHTT